MIYVVTKNGWKQWVFIYYFCFLCIDVEEALFSGVNHSEVCSRLLELDPELVNVTCNGRTLVHEALANGDPIDSFVNLNSFLLTQTDIEDRPPLFDALQGLENTGLVEFLTKYKDSLNFRIRWAF